VARSVFYDIADTPEEAANLSARSLLMIAIEERIKERGWTQAQAAGFLHVNQPRVSDLMTGKLHKFSLDALVNMLPAVGLMFEVRPTDDLPPSDLRPTRKARLVSAPARAAKAATPVKRQAAPQTRSSKVAAAAKGKSRTRG
jgi:predicted XRE-type DNA-binding protein